jgi:hypothetical protein
VSGTFFFGQKKVPDTYFWVGASLMRPKFLPIRVVLMLGSAALIGCQVLSTRPPYPRDPLLLSNRPVAGRSDQSQPPQLVYTEPAPPPLTAEAFVAMPPASPLFATSPKLLAAGQNAPAAVPSSIAEDSQAVPVAPLTESRETNRELVAVPVSRRKTRDAYDYAGDYSWLQGVLELAAPGSWALRYDRSPIADKWGGRLLLAPDERLEQLRPGDLVRLEGKVQTKEGTPPCYQIQEIWLIRRADP